MRKSLFFRVVVLLALAIAVAGYLLFFRSVTGFAGSSKAFYLHPNENTKESLLRSLEKDSVLVHSLGFRLLAAQSGYFDQIKPGKYRITRGMGALKLHRMLQKGRQEEEKLTINKLRLRQDLASLLAKKTMHEPAAISRFLSSNDSLKPLGMDTLTLLSSIIPNTYYIYWTQPLPEVLAKLKKSRDSWWEKPEHAQGLQRLGLSAHEAYTLASIVEEETNKAKDKPLIASVYLNRLKKGMPLQADPTVRYARGDFSGNRVFFSHLRHPSPYNTYVNRGLPPGPICTAQPGTIEAVLNAPETSYLFFVASPDFSGNSVFSTTLAEHNKAAKAYQDSLDAWLKRKAAKEKTAAGKTPA